MFFLQVIRVDFSSLSPYSQLAQFRYTPEDASRSDQEILMQKDDVEVCALWDTAILSTDALFLLSANQTRLFFTDDAHSTTECTLESGCEKRLLPAAAPFDYEGDLAQLTSAQPAYAVHRTITIGKKQEVEEAIRGLGLTHRYRRVCYEAFLRQAERNGFVRSDHIAVETVPFVVASPLFEDAHSYGSRLFLSEDHTSYFTPYDELISGVIRTENRLFFTQPIQRQIVCRVNTTWFESNAYYKERMANHTKEENGVLVVDRAGVKELRYNITVLDIPLETTMRIHVPREVVMTRLEGMCHYEKKEAVVDRSTFLSLLQNHLDAVDLSSASTKQLLREYFNVTSSEDLHVFLSGLVEARESSLAEEETFSGAEEQASNGTEEESLNGTEPHPSNQTAARRLSSIDEETVIATNYLLVKTYGKQDRKVPASVPHFLNRSVLAKLEKEFAEPIQRTLAHRFPRGSDLNFAFLYYWFVYNEETRRGEAYYDSLWSKFLDTDHDGVLNENELRTLAAILHGDNVSEECVCGRGVTCSSIQSLLDCMVPEEESTEHRQTAQYRYTTVTKRRSVITFDRYKACSMAVGAVKNRFPFKPRFSTEKDVWVSYVETKEEETALKQLNDARRRHARFISLKDEEGVATEKVQREVHLFFESLFPIPSQFEIEEGSVTNAEEEPKTKPLWVLALVLLVVGGVIVYCFCRVWFQPLGPSPSIRIHESPFLLFIQRICSPHFGNPHFHWISNKYMTYT